MHLDLKKWLQVFLLEISIFYLSFGDIEFFYFSDQSLYNSIKWLIVNHNSRICLSVFQSITKPKKNDNYNCRP